MSMFIGFALAAAIALALALAFFLSLSLSLSLSILPPVVQEACSEALRQGHVHYAPAAGLQQLRAALAQRASEACKLP